MEARTLACLLDDKRTQVRFTVVPGQGRVIIEVCPFYGEGQPGLLLRVDQLVAGAEAIRDYFLAEVQPSHQRAGCGPHDAMLVPFHLDAAQVILPLTPTDVEQLLRHLTGVIAYAQPRELAPRRRLFLMGDGHLEAG